MRAKRPLNRQAVEAADDKLYRRHEDDPRPNAFFDEHGRRKALDPNDPSQADARREWMTLYAESGGKVEDTDESKVSRREPGSAVEPCPLCWIKVRVLDDKTDEPVEGVCLDVTWPSGKPTHHSTDADGMVTIHPAEPGAYDVTSILEGATYESTLEPLRMDRTPSKPPPKGEPEAEPPETGVDGEELPPLVPLPTCIGLVVEHKVQTGESLDSIAKANELTWKELAHFNWETAEPKTINKHLRDDVGCRKKTKDGYNYSFTSDDDPGILYVPKKWEAKGLPHNHTYTIHVRQPNEFVLILENEAGLRIPEADYEVTFADGSTRKGKLGRNGMARLKDPPPGDVEVVYPDLDDVEAKNLAACVREALDQRNYSEIIRILEHSPDMLKAVARAYSAYYNDYTGKGLVEDIYQETTDPEAEVAIEYLLTLGNLPTHSTTYVADVDIEDELDEELDYEPGDVGQAQAPSSQG